MTGLILFDRDSAGDRYLFHVECAKRAMEGMPSLAEYGPAFAPANEWACALKACQETD